jgi:hypothetical protein
MVMTNTVIVLCGVIAAMIAGFAGYLFWAQKKFAELESLQLKATETIKLKLAAYERLALFTERNKLENLINRVNSPGLDAATMRQLMINSLREEFDHNVTQQLYVDPTIWDAVTRMKEQNMYIINQIGSLLPADATANDLNKQLVQLLAQDANTTMNKVVLDALQYEVKKIIG